MSLNAAPMLRHATQTDWPAIQALLLPNKLPTEGAAQAHLNTYLLAIASGEVVGCAGAELCGQVAATLVIAAPASKGGYGTFSCGAKTVVPAVTAAAATRCCG